MGTTGTSLKSIVPLLCLILISGCSEVKDVKLDSILNPQAATVVDPTWPVVNFAVNSAQVTEGVGVTYFVDVLLDKPAVDSLSVPLNVSGSAQVGDDYAYFPVAATFASGETLYTFSIYLFDDGVYEPDETIVISLGSTSGVAIGGTSSFTLTIQDDETVPTVQFLMATESVDEASGSTSPVVLLSGPSSQDISVSLSVSGTAISGADYTVAPTTVTIPAGSTSTSFMVNIMDDFMYEASETIEFQLTSPVNASLGIQGSMTLTILDNDSEPGVTFEEAVTNLAEGDSATVFVNLSKVSGLDVVIPIAIYSSAATLGADYSYSPSTLTIPAGSTQASFTVTAVGDGLKEFNEVVVFEFGSITNGSAWNITLHNLVINDMDDFPTISFMNATSSNPEANMTHKVAVVLSEVSSLDTTVKWEVVASGTATADDDYTGTSGTLTISAGQTITYIDIGLIDDSADEGDETIELILFDATNAYVNPYAHVVTIYDNDEPFYWTGAANDQSWNNPANWSENIIPGASDVAIFSGGCIHCEVSNWPAGTVDVGGIEIRSNFPGTIKQGTSAIQVGSMGWSQYGGTFEGHASANLTINGEFNLFGGTFIAPIVIYANQGWIISGGNFVHNNGNLFFYGYMGTYTIVSSGVQYYSVNFGPDSTVYNFTGTLDVQYGLTFSGERASYINGGTFNVKGNISVLNGGILGSAKVDITGTGLQTFSNSSGGNVPEGTWRINKPSGTFKLNGNLQLTGLGQDLTIDNGHVDMNGKNLFVNDVLTNEAGGIIETNGGTLNFGSYVDNGGSLL